MPIQIAPMRRAVCASAVLVAASMFAAAPQASAAVTVSLDTVTGELLVGEPPGGVANLLTVTRSGATITVQDTAANPAAAGPACMSAVDTVTCNLGIVSDPFLHALLGDGNDQLTINGVRSTEVQGDDGNDQIHGGDLADESLSGGAGDDVITGGDGSLDSLFGNDGADQLDGGPGFDAMYGGAGPDTFTDTGGSAGDTVSYFDLTDPEGVEVTLDGAANDGNLAVDGGADNVGDGVENVQGSPFGDELQGGAGAELLSGAQGDDLLVGNGGADSFNGADGNDRIEARDGVVDADIDCDNSMGTLGSADLAVIDENDPAPRNCETVQRPGTATPPGGAGAQPGASTQAVPTFTATSQVATARTSAMPAVVGKHLDAARAAVLKLTAGIDLDVVFQKGCGQKADLEVLRQRPAKGTNLTTFEGSDVPVKLYVCIADRAFLKDCDISDLRADVKRLPRNADAEVGLSAVRKLATCKQDYDIRLAKEAEEARLKLEAQKQALAAAEAAAKEKAESAAALEARRKHNSEIKAGLTCPVGANADLFIALTEGYNPNADERLGLKASGPDGWTLPYTSSKAYTSFVDVQVFDRANQFTDATLYIDAEDAGIEQTDNTHFPLATREKLQLRNGGHGRVFFTPGKAGRIRLCAVLETGDEQVLAGGVEIRTVALPAVGQTYTTVGGRELKIVKGGFVPVEKSSARAAGLNEVWSFIVNLFSGASRSVTAADGEVKIRPERKVQRVFSAWAPGQVALNGALVSDPQPPAATSGDCFAAKGDGTILRLRCPVLQATGGAALVGLSTSGQTLVAAGGGNVIKATNTNLVAAGGGNLITDGGSTLVAAGGLNLITDGGSTLVAAGGGNVIGPALAQMVAAGAGNLIGQDGATLVAAGGGNLVAAGGLN